MGRVLDQLRRGTDLSSLDHDAMNALADEVRELLVETVHANGDAGHLASNLGAVELTLALHRVFDSPRDKIIWDVGHQAYVHKMLTGRMDQISTIRQRDGLSPFPERSESPHDAFGVGHAGTALSAATGYAIARDLRGEDYDVVAVVGDGAMTAGMSFEALNHLGAMGSDVIVILNDNAMSISPNVGALSRNINRIRVSSAYRDFKNELRSMVMHLPAGKRLWDEARKIKRTSRDLLVQAGFWEQFGFDYYGPIDGHDIAVLESTLHSVQHFTGKPALIHVMTEKGRGIPEAEADPVKSHSGTYWLKAAVDGAAPTYSDVFGQEISELLAEDPRVVVLTPAMIEGSGLTKARERFPDRVIDVGIAEQHAVTAAAGLAAAGMRPVVAIYSTFLQRGYDSVIHDIALQKLPVVFAIDRAGLVGEDGRTHQGFADISYLRCLPHTVVAAPADSAELGAMLRAGLAHEGGPFAIRYPRGRAPIAESTGPISVGSGITVRTGGDVALIGIGSTLPACVEAADRLAADGVRAGVVNARFAKPLDEALILETARTIGAIVTVEENVRAGGFGEAVLDLLQAHGLASTFLGALTLPDEPVAHASQAEQRASCGLDPAGIATSTLEWLRASAWPASARGAS
ncbi:MAG: 1-deoxy-D-xylulose-5-phosphate synthase [Dehalococcoidia bacterium]